MVTLDGPALRVYVQGKSVQRFPLCRISRVIVSGNAGWSTKALLACADEGITISFLMRDGCIRARWIGKATDRNQFLQRWNDFLDRPDCVSIYRQWRTSLNRRAIRICAWRMGWSPRSDTRTMSQAITEATQSVAEETLVEHMISLLNGLIQARTTQEITRLGLSVPDVATSHLENTFLVAIKWGLYPEFMRWLSRVSRQDQKFYAYDKKAFRFFEKNSDRVNSLLNDVVFRLNRFLCDIQ